MCTQDGDGSQPLSQKQARLLKKLARQPDALAGLLQASTKKSAAGAKVLLGSLLVDWDERGGWGECGNYELLQGSMAMAASSAEVRGGGWTRVCCEGRASSGSSMPAQRNAA